MPRPGTYDSCAGAARRPLAARSIWRRSLILCGFLVPRAKLSWLVVPTDGFVLKSDYSSDASRLGLTKRGRRDDRCGEQHAERRHAPGCHYWLPPKDRDSADSIVF